MGKVIKDVLSNAQHWTRGMDVLGDASVGHAWSY
jgi:hypothetical protein